MTTATAGKIFNQLYFRQAMQDLVDQPLYIKKLYTATASPTYGPVPVLPANTFASSLEKTNPYPYNPAKASPLLEGARLEGRARRHRHLHEAGDRRPTSAVPASRRAPSWPSTSSTPAGHHQPPTPMNAEKSSWAQAGINVTLTRRRSTR